MSRLPVHCFLFGIALTIACTNLHTAFGQEKMPGAVAPLKQEGTRAETRAIIDAIATHYQGISAFSASQSYLHALSCIGPTRSQIEFLPPNRFYRGAGSAPPETKKTFTVYEEKDVAPYDLRALLMAPERWRQYMQSATELRIDKSGPTPGTARLIAVFESGPVEFVIETKTNLIQSISALMATTTYQNSQISRGLAGK